MDDTESLSVAFLANIDSITAAGAMIDTVFAGVASSAESSGSDITASMESAAGSFSSITAAMDEMSSMTATGAEEASSSIASIGSVGEEAGASLSDSIGQASSGFSVLEDAVNALADSVNAAVDEINVKVDSIATNAEESAAQSQSAFSGFDLGGMVNQVGMGIFSLQAMGQMATQTAGAILGPASAAENTQASFSNLLGSTQAATNELDKLNQFAAKTQFKTQDIDNAASSMIAFKLPTQSIIPDLTAVGDALTAVGKGTPVEMQSVVDILGKMSVQGKLTQGDITQLGAHGINAMDAISAGSGLSTSALQDMIAKGTLPAKDAIADLTAGIEKNPIYSGGMAKQSNTLSGQMSTLGSDFDQVMAAALKPALPDLEKTLGKLTVILTDPSFKAFAVTMGKDIATGLDDTITGITNLVDTGKNLVDFFEHNQTAMDLLVAGLAGIGAVVLAVVIPAFVAWAIAMGPVVVETLIVAAPFILLGIVVGAVIFGIIEAVQHWSQIMDVAHGVIGTVTSGIGGFFANTGGVIHNITGGINDAFTGMGKGISGTWNGVVGSVKGALNTIIDGIDSFIGFIDGIQIHIPAVGIGAVHTPAFDWNGVGIPKIPHLATGGTVAPGQFAIAGDPGPNSELVYGGTSGLSVFSHAQSASLLSGGSGGSSSGGGNTTHVHLHFDGQEMASVLIDPIMNKVVKMIRMQGGKMVSI